MGSIDRGLSPVEPTGATIGLLSLTLITFFISRKFYSVGRSARRTGRRRCEGREGEFYSPRALCVSASTSSVDIAVMSWAVANGLLMIKLLGTPFDGQSAEP